MQSKTPDLPFGLPIVDLDVFLRGPRSTEGAIECKAAADALIRYGALFVKDSRFSESDNDAFLDIMEDYFAQPVELLRKDERPEHGHQVGTTPEGTEHPNCMADESCTHFVESLAPVERPSDLRGHSDDHKSRFSYITGQQPPYKSEYPFLDMLNVEPAGFDNWTSTLKKLADAMKAAVEGVGEMAAIGLGLDHDLFNNNTMYGPHWLAPTASDLAKHGTKGTILSGVHRDIDLLSRYPGLNVWGRNSGKRIAVQIPPGPHLFVHAGKQLEVLSGGLIRADFHEIVVNDATVKAIEAARAKVPTRPLIRIASIFFWHLNHDMILDPIPLMANRAREMSGESGERTADIARFEKMKTGTKPAHEIPFYLVGFMPRPPDPPWKVKSECLTLSYYGTGSVVLNKFVAARPCPFFTRGSCLFANSCNFVHHVKSPIAPEIRVSVPTQDYFGLDDEETSSTPPNVTSPSFTDSPPDPDVYASNILSPSPERPRSDIRKRPGSWASIQSIQSAGSDLTYPTDLSPTASRVSSRDEEENHVDSRWTYNEVQELLGNIEFGVLPKLGHNPQLSTDSIPQQKSRPTILIPNPLPEPLIKPPGKQLSFPPPEQQSYDPPQQLLTANTIASFTTSSTVSDPNAQIVAVHAPNKLGEALNLDPPRPRRNQSSRERNVFDIDAESVKPTLLPTVEHAPRPQRQTQLSLNEVLLNVLDPSLRPRRIDRLMQGLSPEGPINSVAQSPIPNWQPSQPNFEGHGNSKSEAFRLHLANVISNTAARRNAPRQRRPKQVLQPPIELSPSGKSEAASGQPDVLPKNVGLDPPNSGRFVMKDAASPNGMSPAFRRPGRPAQLRRVKGDGHSPLTPSTASDIHLPSPLLRHARVMQPPSRRSEREEAERLGSLTLTPLTDSPIDFRQDGTRIGFSPMEAQDAEAAMDVLDHYDDDESAKEEKPLKRRDAQLYDVPRVPSTLSSGSLRKSSRMSSLTNVSREEVRPPELQIPSPPPFLVQAEQEESPHGSSIQVQPATTDDEMMAPPMSPTHSKLRPLRLSLLFDQIMKTPPPRTKSISSVSPSSSRHSTRRPLSALLEPPIDERAEAKEHNSQDNTPLASRTVRRRRSRNLQTESSPNVSRTTTGLVYVKNSNISGISSGATPIRRTRSLKRTSTTLTGGAVASSSSQLQYHTSSQSHPELPSQTRSRHISRPSLITKSVSFGDDLNVMSPHLYTPESDTSPVKPQQLSRHRRNDSHSSVGGSSVSSASSSAASKPPLLFWALASDNVAEVERLLASGEASANDKAGPDDLPALLFTMQNDALKNRTEIVKTLLAHGADPSVLQEVASTSGQNLTSSSESEGVGDDADNEERRRDSMATVKGVQRRESKRLSDQVKRDRRLSRRITMGMNPAIDYYMTRIREIPPKQLEALRKAGFDPLTRTPFHMVGQDLVLQELLRVLARHAQRDSATPVSIIFAGPSGHGKSLLSRNIGELLRIPAHTVNMTNLRSQEEFMGSRSLTATQGDMSLARFLSLHEGQRCTVILEEIEKVADKSASNTLLMPWEVGKLNTTATIYDTSRVIWIATSNAGEDIVFDFEQQLGGRSCERNEYLDLGTRVRRKLIESLGASLVSRATTILPFLAFNEMEKIAIAYQHLPTNELPKEELDIMLGKVLQDYVASEGVRSIQRAVQRHYEEDLW
ncbi:hypothetical protein FRB97_002379 [Tulasnella sp. 331]|nr:hypothetical protein FRB97_002379 [Tulasnella sp. 331]